MTYIHTEIIYNHIHYHTVCHIFSYISCTLYTVSIKLYISNAPSYCSYTRDDAKEAAKADPALCVVRG